MEIVSDDVRNRHIYIAGKQGEGKSNLIFWMALQDIDQGKGICLLDPHGDLVRKIIHYIPEHRVNDTIYIDFTQRIPLDLFHTTTDKEREYLADDIISTFKRIIGTDFGTRMRSILINVVGALYWYPNATFLDIHRMITDKKFRDKVLRQCGNPPITNYFVPDGEFDKERQDSKQGITSRMSQFLLVPALTTAVGHPEPKLKIPEVIESKKVLLVNLHEIGVETRTILGTLIVSQIQRYTMQRPQDERTPFYLYADEFQKFQTASFEEIVSEARKFNLCLTLAHQGIWQIDDSKLKHALRMIKTWLLFNVEPETAKFFQDEIPSLDTEKAYKRSPYSGEMEWTDRRLKFNPFQLTSLGQGECLYRDAKGRAYFIKTPPLPPYSENSYAEIIRKRTIDLYSCELPKDVLGSKEEDITGSPKRLTRYAKRPPPTNPPASR